jgi:RNA polymerase sigma-70 factor (ECF subfamily)
MAAQPFDLTELYATHWRQVWRTLARLGVPPHLVEDAVHDVFLAAHVRRPPRPDSSSGWLLGVAVRIAANVRRRQQRRGEHVPIEDGVISTGRGADDELEARRRLARFEQVVSTLPDEQREAFVLCDLEQLTAREAAEVLDEKVNTVSSRLRLARAALAKILTANAEEAS